jgi:YD repeat-containing protein
LTACRLKTRAYRPDGRTLAFNLYDGVYVPDSDVSDTLTIVPGGYEYRTGQDVVETYDGEGRLTTIARRGRAPVTISYMPLTGEPTDPPPDFPATVQDAYGHTLTFAYTRDANGAYRLASITDPAGNTISYSYTGANNSRRMPRS